MDRAHLFYDKGACDPHGHKARMAAPRVLTPFGNLPTGGRSDAAGDGQDASPAVCFPNSSRGRCDRRASSPSSSFRAPTYSPAYGPAPTGKDEWRAYGYGFPDTKTRLATLTDHLAVITRMLAPGRATYAGTYASVTDAINVPRGLQEPRVPIMVGGNGPNVTWRLAARYADELNLDWLTPDEVCEANPVIASRCEEIGRDPATLRLSVNISRYVLQDAGASRIELLAARG